MFFHCDDGSIYCFKDRGDGSVGKQPAVQAWRTEFGFLEPTKLDMVAHLYNPSTHIEIGVRDMRVPKSPWPALAYTVMNKRPHLKQSGGGDEHLVVRWPPHRDCATHGPLLHRNMNTQSWKKKKQTEINLSGICLCGIKQWKRCYSENENQDSKVKGKGSRKWNIRHPYEAQVEPNNVNHCHEFTDALLL